MISLKHSVSTVFAAIGANRRKAIGRAATIGGNIDRDRRSISSQISQRVVGIIRDRTQLMEIASRLAESDHLDRLHDHLEQMLQREGGGYTLLAKCNVSRFQDINTSFGYDVGDALLIQVGQRLRTLPYAVIGRLSSDEFAVALPLSDPDLSEATIVRIRELLAPKFVLPGATIDVRFSIGYAVGSARDDSIGLLQMAGIALHESTPSSFPDPIEFDRNGAIRIESRERLTSDLQKALAEGAETKDEAAAVRKPGCPHSQGYFFGRPMPGAKFVPLLDGKVLSLDQNDVIHRPRAVSVAGRSRSAVVVDDDPTVRATLSETLEHLGWVVTAASSAEEALALPESLPAPQIVITDVDLGAGMNGFEFCPVARRRWPNVEIVVISGGPPRSEQLDTLSLHDVFLLKPVHMSALEAAIAGRWADRID